MSDPPAPYDADPRLDRGPNWGEGAARQEAAAIQWVFGIAGLVLRISWAVPVALMRWVLARCGARLDQIDAAWAAFRRWLALAAGPTTQETLGQQAQVHAFLARTPFAPMRAITIAAAAALALVTAWGAVGWFVRLPAVKARLAQTQAALGEAISSAANWRTRAEQAEAQAEALTQARAGERAAADAQAKAAAQQQKRAAERRRRLEQRTEEADRARVETGGPAAPDFIGDRLRQLAEPAAVDAGLPGLRGPGADPAAGDGVPDGS